MPHPGTYGGGGGVVGKGVGVGALGVGVGILVGRGVGLGPNVGVGISIVGGGGGGSVGIGVGVEYSSILSSIMLSPPLPSKFGPSTTMYFFEDVLLGSYFLKVKKPEKCAAKSATTIIINTLMAAEPPSEVTRPQRLRKLVLRVGRER